MTFNIRNYGPNFPRIRLRSLTIVITHWEGRGGKWELYWDYDSSKELLDFINIVILHSFFDSKIVILHSWSKIENKINKDNGKDKYHLVLDRKSIIHKLGHQNSVYNQSYMTSLHNLLHIIPSDIGLLLHQSVVAPQLYSNHFLYLANLEQMQSTGLQLLLKKKKQKKS